MVKRIWIGTLCGLILSSACSDNAPKKPPATDGGMDVAPTLITVGATVSGLAGNGLVLQDNGGDDLAIAANGHFTFKTKVMSAQAVAVTIKAQPTQPSQTCQISGAPIATSTTAIDVTITCVTSRYTIGGTAMGLAGSGLVLKNNGGDNLQIHDNGAFTFATSIASGGLYSVSVEQQPSGPSQLCSVVGGAGTVGSGNVVSVVVSCATNQYVVGGTVSGLAGAGLVLTNGGVDLPITANGGFAFPSALDSGSSFNVTVKTQPANPTQACTVANGTGTVAGSDVSTIAVTCSTSNYEVGGTVTGLEGSGLVLQNNLGDNLPVSANGTFTFSTQVASGATYGVTILAQPTSPSQTCVVANGTGMVTSSAIGSATVTCTTNTYAIGGTLSGLSGSGLLLRNNGGDELPVSANGTFTFATAVASGAPFAVTIAQQPTSPNQTCTISGASGTVVSAAVTSVVVNCQVDRFTIGGNVIGLQSSDLALSLNGGTSLVVGANGSFAFPDTVASADTYAVAIAHQPTNPWQTCTLTGASGTVTSANVTSVAVTCTTNHYTVGGTVTGLTGTGLVLRNNAGDDRTVAGGAGTFAFATSIASGQPYAVTVATQPTSPSQTCTVSTGAGNVGGSNVTNVAISCVTNAYAVGGTVSGLAGTVVLKNNGGNALVVSSNGSFTFTTSVTSGQPYAATVDAQPTSPAQTCTVAGASGTVTSAAITSVTVTCVTNTYAIGGTVSGLNGSGLVLLDNGGDALGVSGNGSFMFVTKVASAQGFAVTIGAQPASPTQTCTISGASGTVGAADVSSVTVNCVTNRYVISGTVSGLAGTGLVLSNNSGDDLAVSGNGAFAFPNTIASAGTYSVTVKTAPASPTQSCTVTAGNGTVTTADVTNVAVACTTTTFVVSANVSGLVGTGLVLRNNGGNDLAVTGNGSTPFTTPVASGQPYNVTVAAQPTTQTCTVASPSGTVGASAVSVDVTCTLNGYTVGGTVAGLTGTGLVLRDNGGDDLSINGNGAFTFVTPVTSGGTYAVTVKTHASGQACFVASGSGTIGSANVSSVVVTCYDACFTLTNDSTENLTGNSWFDTCATLTGNTVRVLLLDASGNTVYQASGQKNGTWTPFDALTSTAAAGLQYNSGNHNQIITLDNSDTLMIAGRFSSNSGCGGSMGNGYGIVIYPSAPNYYNNIKMLVMGYRGGISGGVRSFNAWTPGGEISWAGGTTMSSCAFGSSPTPLTPFNGTFLFQVGP